MGKLLSFFDGMPSFIYCVEAGETLVDVAYKLKVPVKKMIEDNGLEEEIAAGQYLYIDASEDYAVIMPEDVDLSKWEYPFEVVEKV